MAMQSSMSKAICFFEVFTCEASGCFGDVFGKGDRLISKPFKISVVAKKIGHWEQIRYCKILIFHEWEIPERKRNSPLSLLNI